jgi:hypothetical protein
MTDIEQLLRQTARSVDVPPSPEVVDADVRRGRTGLVRRRRRRAVASSVGGTVAATALVAATIVVGSPDGDGEAPTARPDSSASPDASSGVRLVTYTGEQPDGFIVEQVPAGWYIQQPDVPFHARYDLVIAANGDNSNAGSFAGKLVVMLLSSNVPQELPPGEPVEVNGHDGTVSRYSGPDLPILTYDDGEGHFVQVQSPPALGWTDEQLASFAEGVTVTADAKAGLG